MSIRMLIAILGVFLLSSCATVPATPEDAVAIRAQQRLDALIAGDFAKAYSYATPAYRQSVALAAHKPRFAGANMWTKAVVGSVSCEVDVCDVSTLISYTLPQIKFKNTRPMKERWIRVDGQWWIYHK